MGNLGKVLLVFGFWGGLSAEATTPTMNKTLVTYEFARVHRAISEGRMLLAYSCASLVGALAGGALASVLGAKTYGDVALGSFLGSVFFIWLTKNRIENLPQLKAWTLAAGHNPQSEVYRTRLLVLAIQAVEQGDRKSLALRKLHQILILYLENPDVTMDALESLLKTWAHQQPLSTPPRDSVLTEFLEFARQSLEL